MVQALGQPRYLPRAPTNALKLIVEDHLEDLKLVYDERFARRCGPLTPRVLDLFARFLRCGDPHFGFIRLRCPDCKAERLLPFSCKARGLCPSCDKRRATEWAARMVEEVLPPVAYAPLVFTVPKIIRPAFLFDRRLYGDLSRVVYQIVQKHLAERFPQLDRPRSALAVSPQSFGSLLNFHPHAHALSACGVFDRDGNFHEDLEVDFASLELPFRDAVLGMLKRRGKIDDDRIALIKSWPHSGFRVHAERLIAPGDQEGLESILEYFERPPVSLKNLTYLDTGMVHYAGRFHPGLGTDHQLVTGLEFLALLVPHIQLRFEAKIHLYGALSTTLRKRWGWIGKRPAVSLAISSVELAATSTMTQHGPIPTNGQSPAVAPANPSTQSGVRRVDREPESDFVRVRRRSWAELIRRVWLVDPELCHRCGGTMKVIASYASPAQDSVIRAILVARKEWDPPWLRARAPPANGDSATRPARDNDSSRIDYDLMPEFFAGYVDTEFPPGDD
ncbi:MAG: transposase zinc-binding domain-containing protein [Planctomycetota bacterium]